MSTIFNSHLMLEGSLKPSPLFRTGCADNTQHSETCPHLVYCQIWSNVDPWLRITHCFCAISASERFLSPIFLCVTVMTYRFHKDAKKLEGQHYLLLCNASVRDPRLAEYLITYSILRCSRSESRHRWLQDRLCGRDCSRRLSCR